MKSDIFSLNNRKREIFCKIKKCAGTRDLEGLLGLIEEDIPELVDIEKQLIALNEERKEEHKHNSFPSKSFSSPTPQDLQNYSSKIKNAHKKGYPVHDNKTHLKKLLRYLVIALKSKGHSFGSGRWRRRDKRQMKNYRDFDREKRIQKARNSAVRIKKVSSCKNKASAALFYDLSEIACVYISKLQELYDGDLSFDKKGRTFAVSVMYKSFTEKDIVAKDLEKYLNCLRIKRRTKKHGIFKPEFSARPLSDPINLEAKE